MNKFKFLLTTLLFFSFTLYFPNLALAADLNIDCPASPIACTRSGLDPLFSTSLDGFWYPGKSITKTLNLKNSDSGTQDMAIRGARTSTVNILENAMHISIVGGTTVIWGGSVADFYSQDKIKMGTFAPGANQDYNFTVFMSSGAGDEYQNKETVFDLTLGFWGDAVTTPPPTSPPGGGGVLGGASAPVCGDTKPGSAPILLGVTPGINSATLRWSEGQGPISYYLITFGTSPGIQMYGNPNIGGVGTTSYTVNNLSGGIIYYFKVRAGNGCATGEFSDEIAVTPLGNVVTGLPGGFVQGVLGTETQKEASESASPVPVPEVQGTSSQIKYYHYWWLFLLIVVVLIALYYLFRRNRKK